MDCSPDSISRLYSVVVHVAPSAGGGDEHFCPRTYLAPHLELRSDIFRPLPHSAKAPVRIALTLNGFRFDSAAVVTNQHAQEVTQILDFDFDVCSFRMTQGVHDRFSANQKEL